RSNERTFGLGTRLRARVFGFDGRLYPPRCSDDCIPLDCMCHKTKLLAILAGATGGAVAIAGMEAFSSRAAFPLVAIPFATSILTVVGSPQAEPAQPRALIGGHLVSTSLDCSSSNCSARRRGPRRW